MNRLQQILSAVLVVQLIVIGVLFFPKNNSASANTILLANVKVEEIATISIEDHDQNYSKLAQQEDGAWVLQSGGDYPVNAESINEMLIKLLSITKSRLVTRTASSHDRLQVAEGNFMRRIEITMKNNVFYTLFTGSSPGTKTVHVRLDGSNEVYLSSAFSNYEINAPASNWIDTIYLSVPVETIAAATLQNQSGTYEFEKVGTAWQMNGLAEGEVLNESNLTNLLNRLAELRMSEPLGKVDLDYGINNPQAVFTFTAFDENNASKTYTLYVGDKVDQAQPKYYAKSSESEYYVLVNSTYLEAFVQFDMVSFLQSGEPTAAP